MFDDEKTPTKTIKIFKYRKAKPKVLSFWECPRWITPDFEFGLRTIMNNHPYQEACQIVGSIKRHFLEHRKK